MIHPKFWLRHYRVRRALVGYPLYDVPHKQAERTLTPEQVDENFTYFMSVRHERLEYFRGWLNQNFGVVLSLDGAGLLALNNWIQAYGGGVIEASNYRASFESYQPPWIGQYVGNNIMFDIGIFSGEYLIGKRPKLHWEIYRGHWEEPESFTSNDFLRPVIGGFPNRWKGFVLQQGCSVIAQSLIMSHVGDHRLIANPNGIIKNCQGLLWVSKFTAETVPALTVDTSNEPI